MKHIIIYAFRRALLAMSIAEVLVKTVVCTDFLLVIRHLPDSGQPAFQNLASVGTVILA